MASSAPETEPQWLANRLTNIKESRLYSLPSEILLEIIELLAIHDRVGIYMIRQVCQRFADLFSASRFRGFHEIDDSIILGREMRNVPLETLPLKAFRERFIYVGFAPYTRKARRVLMRDLKRKAIGAGECGNTDKADVSVGKKPICDYCSCRHPARDFRPSEIRVGDDYVKTCERWYGHQNVCSHCNIGKLKTSDYGPGERKDGEYIRSRDETFPYWSCKQCFKDLPQTQNNLLERFPETLVPFFEMSLCTEYDYDSEDFYLCWCMPLFANMNDKPSPKDVTRSLVQERLLELSEGPYEDLLRLSVGPMASFRDEMFLEPFGEDGIQESNWGEVIHTLETEDGWLAHTEGDEAPLGWSMKDGDLYLVFKHHVWAWSEDYYRGDDYYLGDDGYSCDTRAGELYWERFAAEQEGAEEEQVEEVGL